MLLRAIVSIMLVAVCEIQSYSLQLGLGYRLETGLWLKIRKFTQQHLSNSITSLLFDRQIISQTTFVDRSAIHLLLWNLHWIAHVTIIVWYGSNKWDGRQERFRRFCYIQTELFLVSSPYVNLMAADYSFIFTWPKWGWHWSFHLALISQDISSSSGSNILFYYK